MNRDKERINKALLEKRNKEKSKGQERFFKTGPGEYAYGDKFLGIPVPELHKLSQEWVDTEENVLAEMMKSSWHEERLLALLITRKQYNRSEEAGEKKAKCHFYLQNKEAVNNWDLVDLSAPYILGQETREARYRKERDEMLYSERMWDRRIAIVSTLALIRRGQTEDTLRMAQALLGDKEDLMHKATGWMLREAGKQDRTALYTFLDNYASQMPRTMLRYSLERVPEAKRKHYMTLS